MWYVFILHGRVLGFERNDVRRREFITLLGVLRLLGRLQRIRSSH